MRTARRLLVAIAFVLAIAPAAASQGLIGIGPGPSLPGLGPLGGRPTPAPPPNDPHPVIPWSPAARNPVLRWVWVPPQPVVVDTLVPWPAQPATSVDAQAAVESEAREPETPAPADQTPQFGTLRRTFVVPGYYIAETAVGYYAPPRWVLQDHGQGVYQWRLVPSAFQAR